MEENQSNAFNAIKPQMTTFLLAAALLVFTFFIFGPSALYFGNAQELWFSIADILPIIAIAGIAVFAILNVAYVALPNAIKDFFTALVWGLGIALYMQGDFFQIRYGVLDGREIDWGAYTGYGVVNTLIWGVCVVSPLALCAVKRNALKKIISFSSCIIIAVQVVALVFLGITTKVDKKNIVMTREGIYTLSKNKNVVVFILDTFDAQYMDELLQSDSEFVHQFDGFTYYDNTVGMYPTTKGALPHLLTGIKYLNETTYNEYLDKAFQETNFYDVLKKNNYAAGIYTSPQFFNVQIPNVIENSGKTHITIKNHAGFSTKLYQLAAVKYFPHVLKRMVWMHSEEFDVYKNASEVKAPLYRGDDVYFNQDLLANGFEYRPDKNIFRFYHLRGLHQPYTYRRALNENIETIPRDENNRYEQAKAALQIVLNYISRLKKDGVYDETLMLVMADHGDTIGAGISQNPLLMVKDWNGPSDFSISSIPVSYDNIIPMLEGRIDDNISCNDFLYNASLSNDERYFYYYTWEDSWAKSYLPLIIEYVFFDGKNDGLHMAATSNIFYDNTQSALGYYTFGDTITFGQDGNVNDYVGSVGLSFKETGRQWSGGKTGAMSIRLAAAPKDDILVTVRGMLYTPEGNLDHQTVGISANGQFIEEKRLTSGDWSFVVPQGLVTERKLNLSFEYPDAASPFELGTGADKRLLAVSYRSMTLSEVLGYAFGDTITFGQDGNVDDYVDSAGLSGKEPSGQWSDGKTGAMNIRLAAAPKSDITVKVESGLFTPKGVLDHQTVRISANGQFIEEKRLTSGDWSFVAPRELVTERKLNLSFEYPDAASPFDVGTGADKRLLAVSYRSMTLSENKPQ
jgi:hypothetical protein